MYSDCIPIKEIRANLKNINVVFIVLEVGNATVTKENRTVRTFKVADQTACINVSVWDEPGNLLVPGDIVRLTKGYAAIWRQCLTLYSGKNGDIHKIGDFCLVFNDAINMSEPTPQLATIPPNAALGLNNGTTPNNSNATVNNRSGQPAQAGGNGNGNGNGSTGTAQPTVQSPANSTASTTTKTTGGNGGTTRTSASGNGGNGNGNNAGNNNNTANAANSDNPKPASTTKTNARTGRNNQTRSNVKNDRR